MNIKTLTTVAILGLSLGVFAGQGTDKIMNLKNNWKTLSSSEINNTLKSLTDEEMNDYLTFVCSDEAITNRMENGLVGKDIQLRYMENPRLIVTAAFWMKADKETILEWDSKLAEAGYFTEHFRYASLFPNLIANYKKIYPDRDFEATMPFSIVFFKDSPRFSPYGEELSYPETINYSMENWSFGRTSLSSIEYEKKKILSQAPQHIRRKLRTDGKPIVVKEGEENPVQVAVDALNTALNAPRLAGLKEWVNEWFPDYSWIDVDSGLMDEESFNEWKEKIYFGDIPMTEWVSGRLLVHLGVDGYNQFIEAYNN